MATTTLYGNLCFQQDSDHNLYLKSGSGIGPVEEGPEGVYTVNFDTPFADTPTVVLTQIFEGNDQSDDLDNFSYDGGKTTDNAVLIAVAADRFKLCVGDDNGDKRHRMVGFVAVGPVDDY
jgi:hypothetical protein